MKTSFNSVTVPVSTLVPAFIEEHAPVCVMYSGSVTITGSCVLIGATDENTPYWECLGVTWILDGASVEFAQSTEPNTGKYPLIVEGYDVHSTRFSKSIVDGDLSDLSLRRLLTSIEESCMVPLIEDAAENDPTYLAFVKERKEAKKRVADLRSQLAEAEYILRNPPQEVDEEGDAERRHFSRADDAREARFDSNREPWGD